MQKSTGQLHDSWHNFSKYRPLIRELVTRDLKVKYRRSVLGYMWSILNPLLMMLLQTLVFSYMFRFDIPNFPLYLICGNTLFNFFNESTNMGMGSVAGQCVAYQKSICAQVHLSHQPRGVQLCEPAVQPGGHPAGHAYHPLAVLLDDSARLGTALLLLAFCCGMAVLLSALAVYFRDLQYLYGILTMAWMYATPLFYPLSALPPFMVPVIKLNPLYHYINCMRCLVMYGTLPQHLDRLHRQCRGHDGRRPCLRSASCSANFILYL